MVFDNWNKFLISVVVVLLLVLMFDIGHYVGQMPLDELQAEYDQYLAIDETIKELQHHELEFIAEPGDLTKVDGTVLELTPHYKTHSDFHNGVIWYSYYRITPEDNFPIYYKGDLIYEPRFAQ